MRDALIVLAAAGQLTLAAPAHAADEPMQAFFGNTLVVTNSAGAQARTHFRPDGSFDQKADGGRSLKGTWTVDGESLCLHPDPPNPSFPQGRCMQGLGHKIGDVWTIGAGTRPNATLVEGTR